MGVFDQDFDKADHMGEIRRRDPLAAAHRVLDTINIARQQATETPEETLARQAEFRRTTICGKHIWNYNDLTCRKCGVKQ